MVGPFLKKRFKRILFWFDIFWLKNWKPQKYFCKKLFNLITRQVSEWKAIWSKFMIHVCPIKPLTRLHKWWGQVWFNNNNKINTGSTSGSGCDSVGRAVASDSRGPWFESSHWQHFIFAIFCQLYWKAENKEKEAGNGPKNTGSTIAMGWTTCPYKINCGGLLAQSKWALKHYLS